MVGQGKHGRLRTLRVLGPAKTLRMAGYPLALLSQTRCVRHPEQSLNLLEVLNGLTLEVV